METSYNLPQPFQRGTRMGTGRPGKDTLYSQESWVKCIERNETAIHILIHIPIHSYPSPGREAVNNSQQVCQIEKSSSQYKIIFFSLTPKIFPEINPLQVTIRVKKKISAKKTHFNLLCIPSVELYSQDAIVLNKAVILDSSP